MQKSSLTRALVYDGQASLMALDTASLAAEAARRHQLNNVSAEALCKVLTCTAYLAAWLKDGESSLSVTLRGTGEGGSIHASADGAFRISGRIENPDCKGDPVGNSGILSIVRDVGVAIPITGSVTFSTNNVEEIFQTYFLQSEQRKTAIALCADFGKEGIRAGGVFLQLLPGADEALLRRAEEDAKACRAFFKKDDFIAKTLGYFSAAGEKTEFGFCCRCSRGRAERAVVSLGKAEAERLLRETGTIEVHCDECNTDYLFDADCVARLFAEET